MKFIRKHPLIHFLVTSKGNPKVLLLMSPLFAMPFQLQIPFATLYMYLQGITEVQIGLLFSITMAGQVFFSLFSGIITDKLGRQRATMVGEFFGWGLACFVWAISNNFWLFLIAAIFNSFGRIAVTSFQCLLVEEANQGDMLWIYTWMHIGDLVSVFFVPIGGLLIGRFTLVPTVRGIYLLFGISILIRCLILRFICKETKQGELRMEESKATPLSVMIREYRNVIPKIYGSLATRKIVGINALLHTIVTLSNIFFGLYVTTELGVPEGFLAIFPLLNAVVMLMFMFVVQHKIAFLKDKIPLGVGFFILGTSHIALILIPAGNIWLIIVYLAFLAVANALVLPRTGAMLQLALDPKERARIMAIVMGFTVAFGAPFGFLGGLLSSVDRRLPFVLTASFALIAVAITMCIREDDFRVRGT